MGRDARFIGPVERLLYLRTLPAIGLLPPPELATVAQNTRERSFGRGQRLMEEGSAADSVFFIVEGRVTARRDGRVLQRVEPPFAVGFLPVLSGDPDGMEVRAETDVLALELSAEDLFDALEDNFTLLEAAVRQFAKQLAEAQRSLEIRGLLTREEPIETPYPEGPLDLVQRLLLFRRGGPYAKASLDSVAEIARRAVEVRYEPGTRLWAEGEQATFGLQVIHGVVSCVGERGARRFRMGPGSVLGMVEANARLSRSYDAVTETRLVALRTETEVLFDVLEDSFELGLSFLRFLASVLTALYERTAEQDAADAEVAQFVPAG